MNRTLVDYYRCPEEFVRCVVDSNGKSRAKKGHFRFGPETICFGSTGKGLVSRRAGEGLYDALSDVSLNGGTLRLPFNPAEVVDNLRLERYCNGSGNRSFLAGGFARKLYYSARPFLGVAVRRHFQKLRLSNWRSILFPRWPVDSTVEQLHETLLRLSMQAQGVREVPFIWFWPDGLPSCVAMTHDVETARGRDFCFALMDIDDNSGIKSSFQLIPEERYTLEPSFLENIRARGFEVNVHDLNHDGRLFASEVEFFARAPRINHHGRNFRAQGFRSGALYRNPAWYKALEFSYDMSVPNAAHLDPQRGGCCTVMPFFIGEILELPVTMTQDYSLFFILNLYSIDLWKTQIAKIFERHGMASFIVHPDYILKPRARDIYKSLLAYLAALRSGRQTWIALPREINNWWRARSRMRLMREGNNWVIEGPEKERARLAYAFLERDQLGYRLASPRPQESGTRLGTLSC